ncbi:hypothetical protein C7T35_11525 [Variovorax sp. WS11]|uniref:hypothetical protein n=1 Tax=Variovorax sp. WS11 TaxID=1105204 RepID=UPI000D0D6FFE|nr:hypothetical protein [Variovorax sp. WS11]NDZ13513.1 hypothetical protein [Variovorax sp. WS11]PSL84382.1 hypothetical protein C7T35_11525 [Variovorax sp. WS11]
MATTNGDGAAATRGTWWGWPLQAWSPPSLAPSELTQPINSGWSFFNVTYNNSSAPAIERDVLQQHSYGRQIGRLMDALSVLVERLPAGAKDDRRIKDFLALAKEVAQIKENARLPRLERLQKDIEALRQEDPKAYVQLKAMLAR